MALPSTLGRYGVSPGRADNPPRVLISITCANHCQLSGRGHAPTVQSARRVPPPGSRYLHIGSGPMTAPEARLRRQAGMARLLYIGAGGRFGINPACIQPESRKRRAKRLEVARGHDREQRADRLLGCCRWSARRCRLRTAAQDGNHCSDPPAPAGVESKMVCWQSISHAARLALIALSHMMNDQLERMRRASSSNQSVFQSAFFDCSERLAHHSRSPARCTLHHVGPPPALGFHFSYLEPSFSDSGKKAAYVGR